MRPHDDEIGLAGASFLDDLGPGNPLPEYAPHIDPRRSVAVDGGVQGVTCRLLEPMYGGGDSTLRRFEDRQLVDVQDGYAGTQRARERDAALKRLGRDIAEIDGHEDLSNGAHAGYQSKV